MSKAFSKKIDTASISQRVIDSITDAIITGELKKGSKIPTEEEMSRFFGVSRNSIREATKVLVSLGVLEIRRPEGTYVADGFNDKMLNPLLYGLILDDSSPKSLIELRKIIEVGAAQLAVMYATQEDIKFLKEKLDEFVEVINQKSDDIESILQKDIEFHAAIEKAGQNRLVEKISKVICKLSIPSRRETTRKLIKNNELSFLIESHTQMYEMIKNRQMQEVMHVVEDSYRYWKDVLGHENYIHI